MCGCRSVSSTSTISSPTSNAASRRPHGRPFVPLDENREKDMSITSIDVGGISCQYFAVGAGEPIVLLHCTGHSGRQWAELAAALRADFEVIAPDLCGYGGTAHWPGSGTFNLGVEADLVGALLEKLDRARTPGRSFIRRRGRTPAGVTTPGTPQEPDPYRTGRVSSLVRRRRRGQACPHADLRNRNNYCKRGQLSHSRCDASLCRLLDRQWSVGRAAENPQRIALASRINKVTLDFWATLNEPTRLRDLVDLAVPESSHIGRAFAVSHASDLLSPGAYIA